MRRLPADEKPKVVPRAHRLLAAALGLALLWAGGASYLIVFHDDVLAGFIARQGAMQAAYERQLDALRGQVDHGRAERSETQYALALRVSAAIERQTELERRQSAILGLTNNAAPVADLADPAVTGSIAPPLPKPIDSSPIDPPPIDGLGLRGGDGPGLRERLDKRSSREMTSRLAALEARLDGLSAAQAAGLERIAERAGRGVQRLRQVIGRTGLDAGRFEPHSAAGLGGPLVPIAADAFSRSLAWTRQALEDGQRLRRLALALPLGQPIQGEPSISSAFGARLDPFTRGAALHTGLDLKAEYGEPARATAAGRVTAAEPAGGYGNMVEIDHGNGLATRFAHLARILVEPGQSVRAGDIVGRVGSTGRSTGAHLHYETRIDGEPVDPQRFLGAGRQLRTLLADEP